MMRWFNALLPKEERFFDLFAQHSKVLVAGADALRAMLEGGDAVAKNYQLVMDREHEADLITREIFIAVQRTFIAPFDRGAIKELISSMDNSIDQMQKTAKAVMIFELSEFTPHMRDMADLIKRCAVLVEEAIPRLQSISVEAGRISAITEEISKLEGQADELHDIGLRELFQRYRHSDPMGYITGNEVYDHLEKVVDRFDDVANVLHATVIEHV